MAKTRESRSTRSPLHPLHVPNGRRTRAVGSGAVPSQPLQSAVRVAQTVRLPGIPLPASHATRILTGAVPLPQGRSAAVASVRRSLPLGQFLPDAAREYFGGSTAEAARAGVHGVAAVIAGGRDRSRYPARRRPEEFEHRLVETEGEGARDEVGIVEAERRFD